MNSKQLIAWTLLVAAFSGGCASARKAEWEESPPPAAAQAPAEGADAEAATKLAQEAEELWNQRADVAKAQEAVKKWEELAKLAPTGEVWAKISRGYYYIAEAAYSFDESKKDDLQKTYDIGVKAGERSIALSSPAFVAKVKGGSSWEDALGEVGPEGVPGLYWYATNLGKWATTKGFTERLANKDRLFATMTRVLTVDPDYFYAAPHRYFGAYYSILPGFAGRDLTKSERHFTEAISRHPNYLATKVLMAKELAPLKQDRALFEKLLKEVIEADENAIPEIAAENALEKRKAQDLLKKADDLF